VNITFLRFIFLRDSSSMKMGTTTAVRRSPCLQRCRQSEASNSVCYMDLTSSNLPIFMFVNPVLLGACACKFTVFESLI
jgi:hypothetical protein